MDKKIYDQEFVTTVEINHTTLKKDTSTKDVYHFVYGSQLYGTLFGIFAKFGFVTKSEKKVTIQTISLVLVNYQGAINIGFKQPDPIQFVNDVFVLHVVGLSRKMDIPEYLLPTPIQLNKGARHQVTFERQLHPLPGFEFNPDARKRETLDVSIGDIVPDCDVFDTEFQHRSGIEYYDRALRPGLYGNNPTFGFPSLRCHTGKVNLVAT